MLSLSDQWLCYIHSQLMLSVWESKRLWIQLVIWIHQWKPIYIGSSQWTGLHYFTVYIVLKKKPVTRTNFHYFYTPVHERLSPVSLLAQHSCPHPLPRMLECECLLPCQHHPSIQYIWIVPTGLYFCQVLFHESQCISLTHKTITCTKHLVM